MSGILRSVVPNYHNHQVTKKEDVAKPRLLMFESIGYDEEKENV
jgi:hypothetical protein